MQDFTKPAPALGHDLRKLFVLDPNYLSLNHGSFGTVPRHVFQYQTDLRAEIEANPDDFYKWQVHKRLDRALESVAPLLNVKWNDLVFVSNATAGTNSALRSIRAILKLQGKDKPLPSGRKRKILQLSTVYAYLGKATTYTTVNEGNLEILNVDVEYPITDEDLVDLVRSAIDDEVRAGGEIAMAVIDSITSVPGVIVPMEALVNLCRSRDIFCAVDGAHAIGQIPLDFIGSLKPDLFVTNLHKWLHTPRGAAVLYVNPRFRPAITHAITSDVELSAGHDWRASFHWVGTLDVTSFLAVEAAIAFRKWIGGERAIMRYTHDLAVRGGSLVAKMWGTEVMRFPERTLRGEPTRAREPDDLYAALVNVRVPWTDAIMKGGERFVMTLQERLMRERKMSAQIYSHGGFVWVRFSAQVYVELSDFEIVGKALLDLFEGKAASKL